MNMTINDDVSEDSSAAMRASLVDRMKDAYREISISAKDIFLPPYKENLTDN